MEIVFWSCLALLAYIYFGYPILVNIISIFVAKAQDRDLEDEQAHSVTVLIAAFNEEKCIRQTIQNKLSMDYPPQLLSVVVISDSSEDRTDDIVCEISNQDSRVKLLRQSPRAGKTAALNLASRDIDSDLIVFSDANSLYDPQAVRRLTKCFNDPDVGYVTGKMVYVNEDGSLVGDGCSAYMKYENKLRELESRIGSVVGVDGGIDAIRTSLFTELNADQLPDFVQPLWVVRKGYKVKYCENALLNEEVLSETGKEFKMRVRVALRALWGIHDMRALLNPFKYGFFSIQLFSHKLLRYLACLFMAGLLISNIAIFYSSSLYQLSALGQFLFYTAALVGARFPSFSTPVVVAPYYFCLLNISCVIALYKYLRGEKIVIWKPRAGQ